MRTLFNIFIALVSCQICLGQKSVQLAPALLKYSSVFFKDAAKVEMKFAQEGANIYYTLDGQLPTEKSTIYKKPIRINKNLTTLQVMTSGPSFLPSEIISTTFIKDGLPIQSEQHSAPNEKYKGNGPNTLFDNEGGLLNMKSPTWIGYQQDTIEILVELKSAKKVQSVLIDFLQDYKNWVFLPQLIRVDYLNADTKQFESFVESSFELNKSIVAPECRPIMLTAGNKIVTNQLKIKLYGIKNLPDWLPGKRRHGWIFLDEIKVY
jgi:hypothetical protein